MTHSDPGTAGSDSMRRESRGVPPYGELWHMAKLAPLFFILVASRAMLIQSHLGRADTKNCTGLIAYSKTVVGSESTRRLSRPLDRLSVRALERSDPWFEACQFWSRWP